MDWVAPKSLLELISINEYHKFVLVKFQIKIGYPLTSQSNINAIIGPYGVNIVNLQKKLEPLNEVFEPGTLIPVFLKVYDFDKYAVMVKSPYVRSLMRSLEGDSNFLSCYLVYELARKKSKDLNLIHIKESSLYYSMIGYFKSGNKSIYW
uniref:Ribosomal protein L11 n=1 Tax=Pharyngomonas kirbyi TaxID=63601 RepID=A0A1W6R284_9EUKA|nr:ribosomal protein L11 [Pharyngomonas kirbyi]ARO47990.1 ribosomal protein L11 [Pharyngomonas kirbyi]